MNEDPLSVIIISGGPCLAITSVKNLITCYNFISGIALASGHLVK